MPPMARSKLVLTSRLKRKIDSCWYVYVDEVVLVDETCQDDGLKEQDVVGVEEKQQMSLYDSRITEAKSAEQLMRPFEQLLCPIVHVDKCRACLSSFFAALHSITQRTIKSRTHKGFEPGLTPSDKGK